MNKYGESLEFSDITTMQTGQAPEKVQAPTTEITDVYVRIEWVAPFNNYLEITAYRVLLKVADGDFEEQADLCDGSDSIAVEFTFCTIQMSQFWTERFSNVVGDTVYAKVIAINERGESVVSDANTDGAKV